VLLIVSALPLAPGAKHVHLWSASGLARGVQVN
jgi:hypothetical protein